MVIMVRMVKGRQHSAHILCPARGDGVSRPQKRQTSITEMNLTAQYSFQSSGWSGCGRRDSIGKLYLYRIT
jgi:hypothetical protein